MSILFSDKLQRLLMVMAVIVTCVFLLYPDYLPMIDLPQHAAQVVTLNDMLRGKSAWGDMLFINWDVPYLTTYLLWLGLYQVMSIAWSAKVVVCMIFLFFMYAVRQLRRAFQADRMVDWIALTTFFGFAFQWGFVSFLMGLPVGMMFFLASKRWLENHQSCDMWKMLAWGIAMYFSHILAFALFCFLAYGYFLVVAFRQQTWRQRGIFTTPFLLFAAMLVRIATRPDLNYVKMYPDSIIQYSLKWKTEHLFHMPWDMGFLAYYDLAFNSIYILPVFMGFWFRRKIQYYTLLIGILIVWYVLPHYVLQTMFWYQRFAVLIPIFYYLIFEYKAVPHNWRYSVARWANVVFVVSLLAIMYKTHHNHYVFQHSPVRHGFETIKAQMLPGKRVLAMFGGTGHTDGNLTSTSEYLHYAQWYQAEKQGWVDFSFATAPGMMVRLKKEAIYAGYGENRTITEQNLTQDLDCAVYDYLVMRTDEYTVDEVVNLLSQNFTCQTMKLDQQAEKWLLFSKKAAA